MAVVGSFLYGKLLTYWFRRRCIFPNQAEVHPGAPDSLEHRESGSIERANVANLRFSMVYITDIDARHLESRLKMPYPGVMCYEMPSRSWYR